MKKAALVFILLIFVIAVYGCQTVKGACKGGTEGASKDWESRKGLIAQIMKADDWIRENLW